jgi:hypothetical protein
MCQRVSGLICPGLAIGPLTCSVETSGPGKAALRQLEQTVNPKVSQNRNVGVSGLSPSVLVLGLWYRGTGIDGGQSPMTLAR